MGRSFSATDYKGVNVKGTVVWDDPGNAFVLVEECEPGLSPVLWLVDTVEDVGVSLNAKELQAMLPHMQRWADARAALTGDNK